MGYGVKYDHVAFTLSLTAWITQMAVNLRCRLNKIIKSYCKYKSRQFSHKQLVLVATPVSTGVYFFICLLKLKITPAREPTPSAITSPISNERLGIKYR